jgi:probable phosphoglycerate mutase
VSASGYRAQTRPQDVQDGPGFFDEDSAEQSGVTEQQRHGRSEPHSASRPGERRRRLIVEADGGSRGNPGPAAYGALVRDGGTGEVLNREGLPLGRATNNVAEYSGLIAGLEMAREIDPDAEVDVRMDSKLVVEQMAGRWKVKHPSMIPLARRANTIRPSRVHWTWVPRAENGAADALVNAALDGDPVARGPAGERRE